MREQAACIAGASLGQRIGVLATDWFAGVLFAALMCGAVLAIVVRAHFDPHHRRNGSRNH
jgi:hypothetical protein